MYTIKKTKIKDLAKELERNYEIYGPYIHKDTKDTLFDRIYYLNDLNLKAEIPSLPPYASSGSE